jgi:hypothetical protein
MDPIEAGQDEWNGGKWYKWFCEKLEPVLKSKHLLVCDLNEPCAGKHYFTFSAIYSGFKADFQFDWNSKKLSVGKSVEYILLHSGLGIIERNRTQDIRIETERNESRTDFEVDMEKLNELSEKVRGYCENMRRCLVNEVGFLQVPDIAIFGDRLREELLKNEIVVPVFRSSQPLFFSHVVRYNHKMYITIVVGRCVLVRLLQTTSHIIQNSEESISEDEASRGQVDNATSFFIDRKTLYPLAMKIEESCSYWGMKWGSRFIHNLEPLLQERNIHLLGFDGNEAGIQCFTGSVMFFGCEANLNYDWQKGVLSLKKSLAYIHLITVDLDQESAEMDMQINSNEIILDAYNEDTTDLVQDIHDYCEAMFKTLLDVSKTITRYAQFESTLRAKCEDNSITVVSSQTISPIRYFVVRFNGIDVCFECVLGAFLCVSMYKSKQEIIRNAAGALSTTELTRMYKDSKVSYFANPDSLDLVVENLKRYSHDVQLDLPSLPFPQPTSGGGQNPSSEALPQVSNGRRARLPPLNPPGPPVVEKKVGLVDLLERMERLIDTLPETANVTQMELRDLLKQVRSYVKRKT